MLIARSTKCFDIGFPEAGKAGGWGIRGAAAASIFAARSPSSGWQMAGSVPGSRMTKRFLGTDITPASVAAGVPCSGTPEPLGTAAEPRKLPGGTGRNGQACAREPGRGRGQADGAATTRSGWEAPRRPAGRASRRRATRLRRCGPACAESPCASSRHCKPRPPRADEVPAFQANFSASHDYRPSGPATSFGEPGRCR
jgi:hypothetical protein